MTESTVEPIADPIDECLELELPVDLTDAPTPFFIVGSVRSGTTLLRLILDHHSQIACQAEFEYAINMVSDSGEFPTLEKFRDYLLMHRDFPNLVEAQSFLKPKPQIGVEYHTLIRSFLEQFRLERKKDAVGATVHHHYDRLFNIWPNAKLVHIYRDPRDVANSCVKLGMAGTAYYGVRRWLHAETVWDEVGMRLPEERRIEVTHERLVANTESELRRICEFLGFDFDPGMLDYHLDTTYEPIDPSLVYQWRRKMSGRDVALVEARVGQMLAGRGYEHSGIDAIELTGPRKMGLAIIERWTRMRFRQKRMGFALWLQDMTARWLHIKPWARSIQLRLNERQRQRRK